MQTIPGEPGPLILSGSLDINAAQDLRDSLIRHLEASACLEVDVSQVESFDLTGLQLLCAAKKSAAALGKSFALIGQPAALSEVMARAGLSPEAYKAVE